MVDSIKIILLFNEEVNLDHLKDDKNYYKRYGNDNPYKKVKKLKNLKITIYERKVIIEGSLTVFIYGHNLFCPSYKDIIEALDEISEELRLNIDEGIITRIDLGHNFFVDKPIPVYLMNFWTCSHSRSSIYEDGDSFQSKNSQISVSLYDKIKQEMKKYNFDFSDSIWEDRFFLRYELQLKTKLARRFKMKVVTVKNLKEKDFYLRLLTMWKVYYDKMKRFQINEESDISFIDIKGLTPKKLFDILACYAVQNLNVKQRKVFFDSTKKVYDYQSHNRIWEKIRSLSESDRYIYNVTEDWKILDRKVLSYYKKQVCELKSKRVN